MEKKHDKADCDNDYSNEITIRLEFLSVALRRLTRTYVVEDVCRCCLDRGVEVPAEFLGESRKFTAMDRQVECALVEICDAFGEQHAEPAGTVYSSYVAACLPAEPKFTSCASFCRELYARGDKFKKIRFNNRAYVAGLRPMKEEVK